MRERQIVGPNFYYVKKKPFSSRTQKFVGKKYQHTFMLSEAGKKLSNTVNKKGRALSHVIG